MGNEVYLDDILDAVNDVIMRANAIYGALAGENAKLRELKKMPTPQVVV